MVTYVLILSPSLTIEVSNQRDFPQEVTDELNELYILPSVVGVRSNRPPKLFQYYYYENFVWSWNL